MMTRYLRLPARSADRCNRLATSSARADRRGPLAGYCQPETPSTPDRSQSGQYYGTMLGRYCSVDRRVIRKRSPQVLAMLSESQFQQDRGWSVDDGIDPARRSSCPRDVISAAQRSTLYTAAGFTEVQAQENSRLQSPTLSEPLFSFPTCEYPAGFDYLTRLEERVIEFLHGVATASLRKPWRSPPRTSTRCRLSTASSASTRCI